MSDDSMAGRDVHEELKLTRIALEEMQSRYTALVEESLTGIIVIQSARICFANRWVVDSTGYEQEEFIGKNFLEFVYREDRDFVRQRYHNRLVGLERPGSFEFRAVHKDGSLIFLEAIGSVIRYFGRPAISLFITDISKAKIAEDALRDARTRLDQVIDFLPDAAFIIDVEGRVIAWNRAIESLTGVPRRNMLGRSNYEYALPFYGKRRPVLIDLVLLPNSEYEKDHYRNAMRSGDGINGEVYVSNVYEGKGAHLLVSASTLHDSAGNVIGAIESIRDISDIMRSENALRQSEEKYRRLVEKAPCIIMRLDLDGNITFINRFAQEFFGYPQQELIGRNIVGTIVTPTKGARAAGLISGNISRAARMLVDTEDENICRDGRRVWISWTTAEICNPNGVVVEILCIGNDITERKQLETHLIQAQKMEAVGTLAGGLAHDFNNLMMAIQGNTSLMLLEMEPGHPHFERLKQIEEHVQSGVSLTGQMLAFARKGLYEVKTVNMNDLLDRTAGIFWRTKKEITIEKRYSRGLWAADVNPGQMEQVLINLYLNASQAMPGGGTLYLETGNFDLSRQEAQSHNMKPGRYIRISITDTGMGMDEQTRQRIFEPFFTTKGMGRGTGLGLAIVYGIILNHSGLIKVYSEPGRGTTFNIYLPCSDREIAVPKLAGAELVTGSETILLIDDEEAILELNRELFERLGYRIFTASSGSEAVEIFTEKKSEIDLVIMDMIMPNLHGIALYDKLKGVNPGLKVILSSGYSLNGQARKIMDKGCNGFIQKPFRLSEISQKVREVLGPQR
jgi:PAS domain S-box-containing protein